jgi:Lysozyme inhibitor LprI
VFARMRLGGEVLLILLCCRGPAYSQDAFSYAVDAHREYAAVFGHSDDPCHSDGPVAFETCMGRELAFVESHLDAFVIDIRGVLSANKATDKKGTNSRLTMLNKADAAWRQYRKQVCGLSYDYFRGGQGTIIRPAVGICRLSLDKAYMSRLEALTNLQPPLTLSDP